MRARQPAARHPSDRPEPATRPGGTRTYSTGVVVVGATVVGGGGGSVTGGGGAVVEGVGAAVVGGGAVVDGAGGVVVVVTVELPSQRRPSPGR